MSRVSRGIVAVGSLVALTFGLSPTMAATQLNHQAICSPNLDFTADDIDNPYSPFLPGQVASFHGTEMDEGAEVPLGLRITVLDDKKTLYKGKQRIEARVVEEVEWVDPENSGVLDEGEELVEVSRNYFAEVQNGPRPGTVCYFGEDVKNYEDGRFRGDRSGSWRADAKGNAPGIFMPANPNTMPLLKWQSEDAPLVAEDEAEILQIGLTRNTYTGVIEVEDCNPLELPGPGEPPNSNCGLKYYAPNVGLIVDGPVELTSFED